MSCVVCLIFCCFSLFFFFLRKGSAHLLSTPSEYRVGKTDTGRVPAACFWSGRYCSVLSCNLAWVSFQHTIFVFLTLISFSLVSNLYSFLSLLLHTIESHVLCFLLFFRRGCSVPGGLERGPVVHHSLGGPGYDPHLRRDLRRELWQAKDLVSLVGGCSKRGCS